MQKTYLDKLEPRHLIEEYTDRLLNDGRDARSIYENLGHAKQLLKRGKDVVPVIGRYLKTTLLPALETFTQEEKIVVRHGWVILLCGIKDTHDIEIGRVVFGANLQLWAEWAAEYNPPKTKSN